jgi:hypothetical protein
VSVTTRLVTLQPPGDALDGVLDALHRAEPCVNRSTTVGHADRMPKLSGQPEGACTVVELTTITPSAATPAAHDEFTRAAGESLSACGVPWAWQFNDGPWQYGT